MNLAIRAVMDYGPERNDRETVSLIKELKQKNRIKIYESDFDFITDYFIDSIEDSVEVGSYDLATFIIEFISSSNSNDEINRDIVMNLIRRNKSISGIIHQILDNLDDMAFQYWFDEVSSVMYDSGYWILKDPDGMGHVIVLDMR